jgi:hypothetical protein
MLPRLCCRHFESGPPRLLSAPLRLPALSPVLLPRTPVMHATFAAAITRPLSLRPRMLSLPALRPVARTYSSSSTAKDGSVGSPSPAVYFTEGMKSSVPGQAHVRSSRDPRPAYVGEQALSPKEWKDMSPQKRMLLFFFFNRTSSWVHLLQWRSYGLAVASWLGTARSYAHMSVSSLCSLPEIAI